MSHNKERAEKVCLNCGADLYGRYCHVCGQENLEPKETFWHLITHYFYDITHFDGKFFSTLKYLILRPGFLPRAYLNGHRTSYLHPIRMYVFTSAFFFIIFFSMFHLDHINIGGGKDKWVEDSTHLQRINVQRQLLSKATTKGDSAKIQRVLRKLEATNMLKLQDSTLKKHNTNVEVIDTKYKTETAYDSAQRALPEDERDGWFARRMMHRNIAIRQKYGDDRNAVASELSAKFVHLMPQMLFLSLPLFAFVLWLLYIRRKDEFFYTGHVIFTLYLYIFYFIAYLVFFCLQKTGDNTGWGIWGWVEAALWIYMTYYMYKALRNFYLQRRAKTILKLVLLLLANFFIFLFLFIAFTIFSVYQV